MGLGLACLVPGLEAARPVTRPGAEHLSPRARLVEQQVRPAGHGTWREIAVWKDEADPEFPLKRIETVYLDGATGRRVLSRQAMLADRLMIESPRPSPALEDVVRANSLRPEGMSVFSPVYRVRLPSADIRMFDAVLRRLQEAACSGGFRISPDGLALPAAVPNDPLYATNQTDLALIGAPAAWDVTTGSAGVVVAVIDTGMDMDHPDLAGNLFTNPGEISGNGIDDDGNGLVDDVHGWDFFQNDAVPDDTNSHGTSVSGIVGAVGNNAVGVAGTAWQCRVLPLRAGDSGMPWSNIIQAIDYAIWLKGRGITLAALNNSYGAYDIPSATLAILAAAVDRTEAADILFVAAAGNSSPGKDNDAIVGGVSQHFYPSDFTNANVLSVASTNLLDQLASDSNYGTVSVDLAAPGSGIYSTALNGIYSSKSGTSMACARVSGLAALLVSTNPDLNPYLLRRILIDTGVLVAGLVGKLANPVRVDAGAALQLAELPLFDIWRHGYWGSGFDSLPAAAAGADPDLDGWDNLWEYALSGNPLQASSAAEQAAWPRPAWFETDGTSWLGFDVRLNASDPAIELFLEQSPQDVRSGWGEVAPGYFQAVSAPGFPGMRQIRLGVRCAPPFSQLFLRAGIRLQPAL